MGDNLQNNASLPKTALKNYAVWARKELIKQIMRRAYQYGISADDYGNENDSL